MSSAPVSSPTRAATERPVSRSTGGPSTPALAARWALSHGLLRTVLASRARGGSADARLLRDPALQAEPWEHYRQLREQRPFARHPWAGSRRTTASPPRCCAATTSVRPTATRCSPRRCVPGCG